MLVECISSCLGQVGANSNLEVIVIDDGSDRVVLV